MIANIRRIGPDTYSARFSGRFALVIPFTYRVSMQGYPSGYGETQFYASRNLGPLLGSYQMHAIADRSGLVGGFRAADEFGEIRMRRISP